MSGNPHIIPIEDRLTTLDRHIAESAAMAMKLSEEGASVARVDDEIGFLRTLFIRRETLINEWRRAGGDVREPYTHRQAVSGDPPGASGEA